MFLRGLPHVIKRMRIQEDWPDYKKEEEPNLSEISKHFPLPEKISAEEENLLRITLLQALLNNTSAQVQEPERSVSSLLTLIQPLLQAYQQWTFLIPGQQYPSPPPYSQYFQSGQANNLMKDDQWHQSAHQLYPELSDTSVSLLQTLEDQQMCILAMERSQVGQAVALSNERETLIINFLVKRLLRVEELLVRQKEEIEMLSKLILSNNLLSENNASFLHYPARTGGNLSKNLTSTTYAVGAGTNDVTAAGHPVSSNYLPHCDYSSLNMIFEG